MHIDSLFEVAAARLYHATNFFNALQIIETNVLMAKTEHDLPAIGMVTGVSLTRNWAYAKDWSALALELDRHKLAHRYRLIPFNYWHRGNERPQGYGRQEAEEFVIGPVTQVDRYLIAIHISHKTMGFLQQRNADAKGRYDAILQHPLLKVHSP
jgi:hypothetical protein